MAASAEGEIYQVRNCVNHDPLNLPIKVNNLQAHPADVIAAQQPQHHVGLPLRAPPLAEAGGPPQAARAVPAVRIPRHPLPPSLGPRMGC